MDFGGPLCYDVCVNLRLWAALAAGKLIQRVVRALGLGGGTAAPGLVASAIHPGIVPALTASLPRSSVVVTGTNGKTTTSRLISDMLLRADCKPIHNRAGSNMMRGVVSTLVSAASLSGSVKADVGVWEVDEATLPEALLELRPGVVVITNLFRDQLDRYGEVNTIASLWEKGMALLPSGCTVVLNADDPRVAHLGETTTNSVLYFGVEDPGCALADVPDAADSIHCLRCTKPLVYDSVFSSHMGRYRCPNCGLVRPRPDVLAAAIATEQLAGSRVQVVTPSGALAVRVPLPGLYNVYNALAAIGAGLALGLSTDVLVPAVENFRAAFGRVERLKAGDKEVALFLVKNPAGFNEVIRTVFASEDQRHVLIAINDLLADGTDVSWLWDVDFEAMKGRVAHATVSGIRAADMVLRLKYAGTPVGIIEANIGHALTRALEQTGPDGTLYVLPTYTAMLELKEELARRGLSPHWQDD